MAKLLTCPACGAPLSLDDDDDGVVECFYCKRHVIVANGSLTQAPARKVVASPGAPTPAPVAASRSPERPPSPAGGTKPVVTAMLIGALAVVGAGAYFVLQRSASTPEADPFKVEAGLNKLNLVSNEQQAAAVFGGRPENNTIQNQLTIDGRGSGIVQRATLNWTGSDKRYIDQLHVHYYQGYQGTKRKEDVLKKLSAWVPNRLQPAPNHRISQGDAVLDIDDQGFGVWHWDSVHPLNADHASCAARLNALFALGRAAALDGPAPTPAEIALANGAKLEQAGDIDTSVPVEQAVDFFQKKNPAAWCRMQAGLLCVVDVDDKLIDSVHYTWPNGLKARVGQAKLEMIQEKATEKALRAIAGCLEPVLGKGEEKVVDYVRGTRTWEWKLGKAGDPVLLAGRDLLVTTAEGKALDQPAEWHGKLGKMFSALAGCQL